ALGGERLNKFVPPRLGQLDPRLPHPSAILLPSADFADFAGLADLLVDHPCPVVAPSKAREAIERSCPAGTPIVAQGDPSPVTGLELRADALGGRGGEAGGFSLQWKEKVNPFLGLVSY